MFNNSGISLFKALMIIISTVVMPISGKGQDKLYPPSVEIEDNSLYKFIIELTLAVGKKDSAFIIHHMTSDMMNSFGGDGGINEFREYWHNLEADSDFWPLAERLLKLGGGKYLSSTRQYSIPYSYSVWDSLSQNYDPFTHSTIIGNGVNVRDSPNINTSTIIGQLSYDVVINDWDKTANSKKEHQVIEKSYTGSYQWEYVCTLDNSICGYVYWKYIQSPIDYRMGFIKVDNDWKISFLVAGD